ncbi:uncharacterized protein LOC143531968 [Bidens hawaiensis]|uniref:uncharacterized protein LOC143531968 n=1 Tax=Bidens hawaiensis TaxID=980011 RepID=UPI004049F7EC
MDPNESYFSAWECFQTLLNRCPQHGLSDWAVVEKFYNGLTLETQQRFNTATEGNMLDKLTIEEAEEMFESIALADQYTPSRRPVSAAKATAITTTCGVHHVDQNARVSVELEALRKEVREINLQQKCENCRRSHETADCLVDSQEEVDFLANPNCFFNSAWRNNNSNWRAANTKSTLLQHETFMKEQQVTFQNLEAKFGELSAKIDQQTSGSLPSNTIPTPNSNHAFTHAHIKAVTTRSGRGFVNQRQTEEKEEVLKESEKQMEQVPMRVYKLKLPYPDRLVKKNDTEQYSTFLDILRKLHVNIPFIEALASMPKYAKFLKELLTNKSKLEELSNVTLDEECSAVVQNKLSKKMTDPGSFTIPCVVGDLPFRNALADLGASINLMPYSVFDKLNLGEPTPTRMNIQLAICSVRFPRGIVENLLVKVDKFIFPVDFVILDMDEDSNVPLILGRPFLCTADALINVRAGKITLCVEDETITFDVKKSIPNSPIKKNQHKMNMAGPYY